MAWGFGIGGSLMVVLIVVGLGEVRWLGFIMEFEVKYADCGI